jgi:hypothetical protein
VAGLNTQTAQIENEMVAERLFARLCTAFALLSLAMITQRRNTLFLLNSSLRGLSVSASLRRRALNRAITKVGL